MVRKRTRNDPKPTAPNVHDGIGRDEASLQEELAGAQAQIAPHCATLEHEYLRSCGKMYGTNAGNVQIADDPENWRYTFLRNFVAEAAQGVPEARVEARGAEWRPDDAYMIEQAINAQAHRARLDQFAMRTSIDFAFRSARAVCGLRKRYGRLEPFAERLAFDELLFDPSVTDRVKARWHAHRVARDIDQVIAEAEARPDLGWNLPMLKAVRAGLANDPRSQRNTSAQVERFELVYWPMWFPDEETDDPQKGYHGTVHYVLDPQIGTATNQRHGELRKPEAFFGPEHGPYAFSAGFKIGELPVELAPLVASGMQGGFANDIMRAVRDAAASYKNLGVMQDDVSAAKLRNAVNGQLVVLPRTVDIRQFIAQIEMGGMQPQHVAALQQAMESLQRSLGSYSRLGDVEADATATAIQNAQMGYATTMGLWVGGFHGFLRQVFANWAYSYDMHPEVGMTIGPLPPEIAQQVGAQFVETRGTQAEPERHRDMALRIDPMSTRGKNEYTSQLDMQAALGMLQFFQALGPHAVAVDTREISKQTARGRGAPWIDKLVDHDALRQIAAMQIGAQEAPPPTTTRVKPQITFGAGSGSGSTPTPMGASLGQPQGSSGQPRPMRKPTAPQQPKPAGAAK